MKINIKLKKCPFCGSDGKVIKISRGKDVTPLYQALCDNPNCGVATVADPSCAAVVAVWERRTAYSTYYNRIDKGVCVYCGKNAPRPGRRYCFDCAVKESERQRKERKYELAEI